MRLSIHSALSSLIVGAVGLNRPYRKNFCRFLVRFSAPPCLGRFLLVIVKSLL